MGWSKFRGNPSAGEKVFSNEVARSQVPHMQIQIREHTVRIQPDQRAKMQRRIAHALGSFVDEIDLVSIYIDNTNRGYGAGEFHCRVIVKLPNEPEMYANASHRSMETVIDLAAEHIRQVVQRQFRRREALAAAPAA